MVKSLGTSSIWVAEAKHEEAGYRVSIHSACAYIFFIIVAGQGVVRACYLLIVFLVILWLWHFRQFPLQQGYLKALLAKFRIVNSLEELCMRWYVAIKKSTTDLGTLCFSGALSKPA